MIEFSTTRLTLTEFSLDDTDAIITILNDLDFIQYVSDKGIKTHHQAEQYLLNGPLLSYRHYGYGLFKVLLQSSKKFIGTCGLINREKEGVPFIDVGYAFLPKYRGQGYAIEAVSRTLFFAKQTMNLNRVGALINPNNKNSIHLVKKLGMTLEENQQLPTYPDTLVYMKYF